MTEKFIFKDAKKGDFNGQMEFRKGSNYETWWRNRINHKPPFIFSIFSVLYKAGLLVRHFLYDKKWKKIHTLPVPVISIGNISAGGCGKTPFTYLLAEMLIKTKRVAILSRGYRAAKSYNKPLLATDPQLGDEAYWLAHRLPSAQVWIDPNRIRSGKKACKEGAEVIILDDGMQHRRLSRNLEIVLIDAKDPMKDLLPKGFLRDLPSRLSTADLLIVTNIDTQENFKDTHTFLRGYSNAPILQAKVLIRSGMEIRGKKVGVFCGIAKPDRFFNTLKELELEIVHTETSVDHHLPSLEECTKKALQKGATHLVCTEKDSVKIPPNLKLPLPIVPIGVDLKIVSGEEELKTFLDRLFHE